MIFSSRIFITSALSILIWFNCIFFGGRELWVEACVSAGVFSLFFLLPQSVFVLKKIPLFFTILLTFTCLSILLFSVLLSNTPLFSFIKLIPFLACAVAAILVFELNQKLITFLMVSLLFLGVFEMFYGYKELYSTQENVLWVPKKAHLGYLTGTYLNRNHLAGLFELLLGINLGLFIFSLKKKQYFKSTMLAFLWACLFFSLLKTGSRSGVLCASISILFFFCFSILKRDFVKVSAFLFLFVGLGAAWCLRDIIIHRVADLLLVEEDLGGRIIAWKDTWRLILDHPWTGVGLGNFKWVFPQYQSGELLMAWNFAHNDYLQMAAEIGLPATIVLIGSFIYFFARAIKCYFFMNQDEWVLGMGALTGVLSLSLHGFSDYNFSVFGNFFLWSILFACGYFFLNPERNLS